MGKSRSTTTGQSGFIEQYWKVISGVLFAALALGYTTNILKKFRRVFFLSDRVMSVSGVLWHNLSASSIDGGRARSEGHPRQGRSMRD